MEALIFEMPNGLTMRGFGSTLPIAGDVETYTETLPNGGTITGTRHRREPAETTTTPETMTANDAE
ncbi:hypothetical protein ACLF3G_29045 [Falsiroseomonas sp. HC035]|uniref:hypothetical protein n=1 Tax=Falsiroseomonas sp. HC035 TaxID=3390999 RepID=UPI003D31E517